MNERSGTMAKSKTDFSEDEIREQISKASKRSEEYANDIDKFEDLARDFENKLKKIPGVGEYLSDVAVLVSMARAYIKKEYTTVSWATIAIAIAGIVYVVNPMDLLPDMIPFVGYLDDGAVMAAVLKMIHDDLKQYKEWQKQQGRR